MCDDPKRAAFNRSLARHLSRQPPETLPALLAWRGTPHGDRVLQLEAVAQAPTRFYLMMGRTESDDTTIEGLRIGITENVLCALPMHVVRSPWTWAELCGFDDVGALPEEPFEWRSTRVRALEGIPKLHLTTASPGMRIQVQVRGAFDWLALAGESLA